MKSGLHSEEKQEKQPSVKKDIELDHIRPDLAEVIERYSFGLDENRPDEVARRNDKNRRTARTYVNELCDPDTFIEYGAFALAAQRQRRSLDDLIKRTPTDGMIAGIGSVNGSLYGQEKSRCMIMAYDYTVLAGTQGFFNHKKKDRILQVAYEQRLPLIYLAEGGGGRPGDVDADGIVASGLDLSTFYLFARLSGEVPVIGVVTGYCFAGNSALLGCCDVIISTRDSNIGMGGPVMIEGGGLGVVKPEDVGPMDIQTGNGTVDILVADDKEAIAATKKYLSYFQGADTEWEAEDQRILRRLIPENRRRVYDIRTVIKTLADKDSFMELRAQFGPSMITGFMRIEGKPFGVFANNCKVTGGAIEAEGADKVARLQQICSAHGLPILSLIDTPGFMVGPEIEKRAQVRHVCRMFVVGANITVPIFAVVLRRGYGLGAMAMAGGGFLESVFTASWPTGEFGGMGLEGAVKAGFRKELEAVKDPQEREALYETLVAELYRRGKAINVASYLELDAVIDPADTRKWILRGLPNIPSAEFRGANHNFVDPW
ncbi:MAG: hypothetical protein M0P57_05400 [Syntrophales bacterium]|jgi:acetyl-CoA carboxylase carboxyltransferase component|nr:hypothetical protein [Syntrophales bacterium]MDY0044295.1 carboxyl transferase domain-containing protein [Syntrophales bacterium]